MFLQDFLRIVGYKGKPDFVNTRGARNIIQKAAIDVNARTVFWFN